MHSQRVLRSFSLLSLAQRQLDHSGDLPLTPHQLAEIHWRNEENRALLLESDEAAFTLELQDDPADPRLWVLESGERRCWVCLGPVSVIRMVTGLEPAPVFGPVVFGEITQLLGYLGFALEDLVGWCDRAAAWEDERARRVC